MESSKMVFSCRRGAIFEKITFFRSGKVVDGYFHDFLWSWGPFREPFWDQNRIQKSIKKSIRFLIDFGCILAPILGPFWHNFASKNRSKIKVWKSMKIIHGPDASLAANGTAVPSKTLNPGPRGQLKPYEHSTACQGTVADFNDNTFWFRTGSSNLCVECWFVNPMRSDQVGVQ